MSSCKPNIKTLVGFLFSLMICLYSVGTAEAQPLPGTALDLQNPVSPILDEGKVTGALNELGSWNPIGNYAFFFEMLPKNDENTLVGDINDNLQRSDTASFPLWKGAPEEITVTKVTTLSKQYENAPLHFNSPNFVSLNGLGTKVPFDVAESAEAGFVQGLVTRLVLFEYQRAEAGWKRASTGYGRVDATTLALLQMKGVGQLSATPIGNELLLPATYTTGSADDTIKEYLASHDIQPTAILYGWQAGDQLAVSFSQNKRDYLRATWTLLLQRYNAYDIGRIVGYTLNYLTGFVKSQRIQALIASGAISPPVSDRSAILDFLANDKGVVNLESLTSAFDNTLIEQFYAESINTTGVDMAATRRRLNLTGQFLTGFEQGTHDGVDVAYADIFNLAYNSGYNNGFRNGYQAGYAAGERDGYVLGYTVAWKQANVVIANLQTQLDEQNDGGGFFGFLSKAAKFAGPVIDIIGAIAA